METAEAKAGVVMEETVGVAAEAAATTAAAAAIIPAGAEAMTMAVETMAAVVEDVAAVATMRRPDPMAEAGAAPPPTMPARLCPKGGHWP